MENKTYLTKFVQSFDTIDNTNEFIALISKYIKPDQIITVGTTVSVEPANRSESWFLTLLILSIAFSKAGFPLPKDLNDTFTFLSSNLGTDKADEVADCFEKAGISQTALINEANKLSA